MTSEASAGNKKKVISRDHSHGDQGAGGTASATGLRADRYRYKRKNEASEGKRQATMKFHARFQPARAVICYKTAERTLGIADLPLCGRNEIVNFYGPIALSKGGDGIAVRAVAIKFVGSAALKM